MSGTLILTILTLIAGFYMAWNIGANDVSNAMGTSVGSGALTLFNAVILAGILEFCGAFFLGGKVSETIQSGIISPLIFSHNPKILLYGMLAALIATAFWLQIASYFGWPISTTHAIVGALLGFGLIVGGPHSVQWAQVGKIALSWIISPALSGLFAYFIFSTLQKNILFAVCPIHASRRLIPIMVFIVFFVFTLSILFNGLGSFHIQFSLGKTLLIGIGNGLVGFSVCSLIVKKVRFPDSQIISAKTSQQILSLNKAIRHLKRAKLSSRGEARKKIDSFLKEVEGYAEKMTEQSHFYTTHSQYNVVEKMFGSIQIISAAYVAFAHGANDVANAIGPVATALNILKKGTVTGGTSIPTWLLSIGGVGIVIGLATWGWRVMETIGRKITELTPTRGFSAEFGAAITILIASKLGLPISTTHCIVGAVLGVGLARGLSALNLRTLREIVLSWIITIPSSAIVCMLIFYLIREIAL